MSKFNSPKNKTIIIKCPQKGDAHAQCMNNDYEKFKQLGAKTELDITQTRHHLSILIRKKFKTPKNDTKKS